MNATFPLRLSPSRMTDPTRGLAAGHCPICDADDAFVELLSTGDEYYVECVNCKVYRASRRAFRHFEYLRWRQDPAGLARLDRLGSVLRDRQRSAIRLEYDTWESLLRDDEPRTGPQHTTG
jgi:hypothetical protein